MAILRRKVPVQYIPIHEDNIGKKNWIILLEVGTIVGQAEKLRVAKATKEKTIVTKYDLFLRKQHYLVIEEYDPQFHVLYFCPQLYKSDSEGNLFALEGEEIGNLVLQSVQGGVLEKQPWYDPSNKLQGQPKKPISSALRTSHHNGSSDRNIEEGQIT
jgi:Fe-S cluster biosynthesis and repair protein YggX